MVWLWRNKNQVKETFPLCSIMFKVHNNAVSPKNNTNMSKSFPVQYTFKRKRRRSVCQRSLTDAIFELWYAFGEFHIRTRKRADNLSSSKISLERQDTFDHIVEALKTAFTNNTINFYAVIRNGHYLILGFYSVFIGASSLIYIKLGYLTLTCYPCSDKNKLKLIPNASANFHKLY